MDRPGDKFKDNYDRFGMDARRTTFVPRYDRWEAPEELLILLQDKRLTHADRAELVIAFHAASHGGNSPSYQTIADTIGTALCRTMYRADIQRHVDRLIAKGRAMNRDGKIWLTRANYTHPVILDRFQRYLIPEDD